MPLMNKFTLSKQHKLVFMLHRAKGGRKKVNVGEEDCACFENCNSPEEQLACRAEIGLKKKKVLGGLPSC